MPPALVLQTSFLGDVVLTTPLLAWLAARGPVDVVATPAGAAILDGHPAVRRVLTYDKRRADAGLGGLRRLAARLRAERYAEAYLAQGSLRTAAVAALAGIPVRRGFDTSGGRWLYTHRVRYRKAEHHARRLLDLAAPADAPLPRPTLHPSSADHAAADALLARAPFGTAPFVALAPGSVWGTKRWPGYPALVAALPADVGLVVVGAPEDAPQAAAIAAAAPDRVLDATGQLRILATAALLARARALVTNDSLPQHLASAMDVPTLTVFGPTVPQFGFGPLASRATVVEHPPGLACRPCSSHGPATCPVGHWHCMREISPTAVASALDALAP
ncbi:MAG: lipopolysaccharide heptosyltransferase II [Gemmatimonadaceae bacterium]|jgi:heptosyltransferase-2|nr:lipopolysaccharide heptosyltransferase II [Gemmatimonadaceae bacterium]